MLNYNINQQEGRKMESKFNLSIKNFGPINDATVNLNKLNVVGGVNASGKSFYARLLFCIVTALSDEGKRIDNEAIKNLFQDFIKRNQLDISVVSHNASNSYQLNELMDSWEDYEVSYEYLDKFYNEFVSILNESDNDFEKDLKKIRQIVDSHENKFQYIISVLRFVLSNEFGFDQMANFTGSEVNVLMTKENCDMMYNLHFEEDSLKIGMNAENQITCREFSNVVYIDSMSAMDFQLTGNRIHYHYISLYDLLSRQQPNIGVYDDIEELNIFSKKFNGMLNGNFKFNPLDNIFSFESNGKEFDVKNIASGYKQIGVLQKLINNHQLTGESLLILDEPETNLHPSFQIQLAHIIVQMVKKLDIMVYINSHSPFIIEALEVYSKKEGIEDFTSFFMTQNIDENMDKFDMIQIEVDDLKILYDNLSNPFRTINNIRFENEINDLD